MQALLDEIRALETRVNDDLLEYFGEINWLKVLNAYGAGDSVYLHHDDLVNCAGALASLTQAQFMADLGDIPGAYKAINQATYFWTMLYNSEQHKQQTSNKARDSANKGHAINKATKADAIQYYLDNRDLWANKDKAAEALSVLYNRSFATARGWLRKI